VNAPKGIAMSNLRTIDSIRLLAFVVTLCGVLQLAQAQDVITYYHDDVTGSPVAGSDVNGNVVWREDYTPYGERRQEQVSGASNRRWFTGHPHEDYTGLTYMGARHYDPMIGRFMSVDPVAPSGENQFSFSRYAYGNNNPFRYIDPDGRETVGELFDRKAMQAASEESGLRTYLWAFAGTAWEYLGAEGVSQVYDKGTGASGGSMVMATLEVVTLGKASTVEKVAAKSFAVLDTNAVIAAVEKGQVTSVLKGRSPLIPITAIKEFLAGGGSINALRTFLIEHGGRVARAGEETAAANLRSQATKLGRALGVADSRIAASAAKESAPVVTKDRQLANFLKAIGVPVEGF